MKIAIINKKPIINCKFHGLVNGDTTCKNNEIYGQIIRTFKDVTITYHTKETNFSYAYIEDHVYSVSMYWKESCIETSIAISKGHGLYNIFTSINGNEHGLYLRFNKGSIDHAELWDKGLLVVDKTELLQYISFTDRKLKVNWLDLTLIYNISPNKMIEVPNDERLKKCITALGTYWTIA